MIDEGGDEPGEGCGVGGGEECPFPAACFSLDGCYCGDAREIEEDEEEESEGGEWGDGAVVGDGIVFAIEYANGGCNYLLGTDS